MTGTDDNTGPLGPPVDPQSAATGPASAATGPASAAPESERGVRLATIVWGAILLAVGAGIVAIAAGASIDLELALIIGLTGAGLALVVGSVISNTRKSGKTPHGA